jgi:hypothetical protein
VQVAKRIVFVFMAGALAIGWAIFLSSLSNGQGLVSIDFGKMVMNWFVVGAFGCFTGMLGSEIGGFLFLGWPLGQLALFVYDGMPKGRSPQMFAPTNVSEAAMYAIFFVAVLNWSILPGGALGVLLRGLLQKKSRSNPS